MFHLTTVQFQSEFKIKILSQNQVYGEDGSYLTPKSNIGLKTRFPEALENTPYKFWIKIVKNGHKIAQMPKKNLKVAKADKN